MGEQTPEIFECFACGRQYRWRPELAGQTVRCRCEAKVRCPSGVDETFTAGESLDDTVADVELEESFDVIEESESAPVAAVEPALTRGPIRRNRFGFSAAGETLAWGIGALVCLSSTILASLVPGQWVYVVIAGLTFWCAIQFYRAWKRWTRGRPWLQCLAEIFGES